MRETAASANSAAGLARLASPLRIGSISLPNRVFLAPMSGVTDIVFRRLAERAGAGLVFSEMVASEELCKKSDELHKRAKGGGLRLHAVQLAGRESHWMGEAAKHAAGLGAELIDINMGCPAKKVTGGASGSALMRNLDHALTLVEATVRATQVPVTLKMRLGWDTTNINAPELAYRAQDAGVRMITVHGRTRCQFYKGAADWTAVQAVRDRISIPLVINGDICDAADALKALEASGADAVMVGRGSYGRPWLAGSIAAAAEGTQDHIPRSIAELASYAAAHYEAMLDLYGTVAGARHARKHLDWYLARLPRHVTPEARAMILTQESPARVLELLTGVFEEAASGNLSQRLAA